MHRPRASTRIPIGPALFALALAIAGAATAEDGGKAAVSTVSMRANHQGAVPTLEGGVDWINVGGPIHMSDLKGKVVVLDFWTYCCINCHHVLPDLAKLEQKYKNELVVIGVHTPKFSAEEDTANIRKKVAEYRIKHPVINDANHRIWNFYGVESWPTLVLIDPDGNYVGAKSGEGNFVLFDRLIGDLVAKAKAAGTLNTTPLAFRPESEKPHAGGLLYPGKVTADKEGNRLFITDTGHNRLVVSDLTGAKNAGTIGSGVEGSLDGNFATAQFNRPQGTCLVGEILFVADTENHMIRAVDFKERTVKTVAGTGHQGEARKGTGPALKFELNSPWDLVKLPGQDVLAVAMAGPHQIWRYDYGNEMMHVWLGSGLENIVDGTPSSSAFAQPSGLATDGTHLFVADSEVSGVRQVSLPPRGLPHVGTVVGQGLFKFGDVDGQGPSVRLQHCLGLAYNDGSLYIADSYNNKIKVCDPKTRAVSTYAGTVKAGSSDSPPQFDEPAGLSIAGTTLYVADTNNHAIRAIDLKTKAVTTLPLAGLTPPHLYKVPTFPNAQVVNAAATKVEPGGEILLDVTLPVPDGFKVNVEGPITYLIEAPGRPDILATSVKPEGDSIPAKPRFNVTVPLATPAAAGTKLQVRLSIAALVCREGREGLCMPKSVVYNVPIDFEAGGSDRVTLTH